MISKSDVRALTRGAALLESQRADIKRAFRVLQDAPALKAQHAMLEQAVRTLADSPALKAQHAMLEQAVRTLADSPALKAQHAMLEETLRTLVDSPGLKTQKAMLEQAMRMLTQSGLLDRLGEAALEAEARDSAVNEGTVTVLALLAAMMVLSTLLGFRLWEWNRLNQDLESVDRVSLLSDAELIAGWTTPAFFLTRQALRAVVGGGAARPGP